MKARVYVESALFMIEDPFDKTYNPAHIKSFDLSKQNPNILPDYLIKFRNFYKRLVVQGTIGFSEILRILYD